MKTRYYFLLPVAALLANSACYAANTIRMKEAPRSVMESTSHSHRPVVAKKLPATAALNKGKQKTPAKPNDSSPPKKLAKPPKVTKPPQVAQPAQTQEPPHAAKPPQAPKAPEVASPPQAQTLPPTEPQQCPELPQIVDAPQNDDPWPLPEVATDLYFPPSSDDEAPSDSVTVPEPGTPVLFVTAFGLLLMFRRSSRPARSGV